MASDFPRRGALEMPALPPSSPMAGASSLPSTPAGLPPAAGVVAGEPSGGAGFDPRQLLALLPLIFAKNPGAKAAFLQGWQRAREQDQQRKEEERRLALEQQQLDLAASGRQEASNERAQARADRLRAAAEAAVVRRIQELQNVRDPDAYKQGLTRADQDLQREFGPQYQPGAILERGAAQQPTPPPIDATVSAKAITRILSQVKDDGQATALLKGSQWKDAAYQLGYLLDDEQGQTMLYREPEPTARPEGGFSLSPGQTRFDAAGKPIASVPPEPKEPKAQEPRISPYAAERTTRVLQSIDELIPQISRWTVGAGSALSWLPETQARTFSAQLDTLKANIAFNELTAMREASKTGGALGQVSDREARLLQSALGALDAGQSPADLKTQLEKIRASLERWQNAMGASDVPASTSDTRVRVQGPHGETGTVPAGTDLPPGWKVMG